MPIFSEISLIAATACPTASPPAFVLPEVSAAIASVFAALSAVCRIFEDICSIVAEISSVEAACSEAPEETAWLAALICSPPAKTC